MVGKSAMILDTGIRLNGAMNEKRNIISFIHNSTDHVFSLLVTNIVLENDLYYPSTKILQHAQWSYLKSFLYFSN